MSDTMLHGILQMPPELWSNDPIDVLQRHGRYLEAFKRIMELERERDEARRERDEALQRLSVWHGAVSQMKKQLSFAPPFHQGMDSQEEAKGGWVLPNGCFVKEEAK